MNKKDKPGLFSLKKKKKNKSKDIGPTEEEITKLTDRPPEREEGQTQVQTSVRNLKNEKVGGDQQRVNERPVDVGPTIQKVVSHSPQVQSSYTANPTIPNHNTGVQKQYKENGKSGRSTERMDPKGSKRVHSFSAESSGQGTSQLLSKEEKEKLKHFASERSPHSVHKNDSLSYENEEETSSKKKKKVRSLLKPFKGKKEKAKRSLAKSFEEEAAKTKEETTRVSPDDDDADEEDEDDDWENDHNNPFSSSFQPQEVHKAQPVAEKVQQKEVPEVQFYVERENSKESDNVEVMEDVGNSESKAKKKKFKVPSFRKGKKDKEKYLASAAEIKSEIRPTQEKAIQQHPPQRTASLPVKLEEDATLNATTMPDVVIRQPGLLATDKPRVHNRSYEAPDNFETAENSGQLLSREERNKSKQFSSMRISKTQQRPALSFIKEEGKSSAKRDDITYEDEELPANINKTSRQESKFFSSFRRRKSPKKLALEQVAEDVPEDAEDSNDLVVSNPFSPAHKQSEAPGVRSSAPSNFAGPSNSASEMSAADGGSRPRAVTQSVESATLARNEGILEKETKSDSTQKKKKGSSIKKTFSFRRSSKESKEQESSFSTQQIEDDVMEEEEEESHPLQSYDAEEFSNSQFQENVQESEADLEERKRQLELVFQEMESENEDEDKGKPKSKKTKILKALKKINKKKKTKSDQPEGFPLMEPDQQVESEEVKKKDTSEKIVEVKGQLVELKDIAHDNIHKLYEREDNLEDLEDRAGQLSETASMFHKTSIQVKTKMETCNKRTKRIIIGVSIALLALVIIILIAVVANKSNDTEIRTVHIVHVVNGTVPYITPSPG